MTEAHVLTNDPLQLARGHVDANLFETLSLAGLAGIARLSPYHFSRQFTARFGESPMAYVRSRRLIAAAEQLVDNPGLNLIDLAFDCGFDSQEGFTRAFKRAFRVPPGQYRRGITEFLDTIHTDNDPVAVLTWSPEPVMKPALRLAGLSSLFDDATKSSIPALWMRLVPHLPLKGQVSFETFGVMTADPAADGEDCFRYMAAVCLEGDAAPASGIEVVELPARPYLVFHQEIEAEGLHPQMQAAARAIWGQHLPASAHVLAQAPDIEYYPPTFQPGKAGWVEWWIPVEG